MSERFSVLNDAAQSDSQGVEVIGDKALCTCTNAASPTPVQLKIISQQKTYCNGGTLLVATTMDNTVASLNFGSCKPLQGPCAAMLQWQKPYDDIKVLGALKILTMDSSGMCSAAGGKIEFKTSGQSQGVPPPGSAMEAEAAEAANPLIDTTGDDHPTANGSLDEGVDTEKMRKMVEDAVEIVENAAGKGVKKAVTGIKPVTYPVEKTNGTVKQPVHTNCTFQAEGGETVIWKIRDEKMNVIGSSEGSAVITVSFPALKRYVIEAYATNSYVKDGTKISDIEQRSGNFKNALIVQGAENEIQLKAGKDRTPVDEAVIIKAEKLFEKASLNTGNIDYKVLKNGQEVDASQRTFESSGGELAVRLKEEETYVVSATSSKGVKITPTQGIKVEKLKVERVSVNKQSKYKARKNEELKIEAQLNFPDPEYQSKVKWVVEFSETGTGTPTQVYPESNAAPPLSIFKEAGFYDVYAYINGKSSTVKAVLQLAEPKFVEVKWKDKNGQKITEIGKREEVYANIRMEAVKGLELNFDLYQTTSTQRLLTVRHTMAGDQIAVISIKIPDQLQEGDKLYFLVSESSAVLKNKEGSNPKNYSIRYTLKESLTSLAFYADKDCKQSISSAAFGSTVYAQALSRNLSESQIQLKLTKKTERKYWFDKNTELLDKKENVDANGRALFTIKVDEKWKSNGFATYSAYVEETGNREFGSKDKTFSLGKDLQFIQFIDKISGTVDGKTITQVQQTGSGNKTEKNKCPKCTADITIDEIKKICVDDKGKCLIADTTQLQAAVNFFNANKEHFDLTTCTRKAHFFAQIAAETHFSQLIEKSFIYQESALTANFKSFQTVKGKENAAKWGLNKKNKEISKENQIKIANWAYAQVGNGLGNNIVAEKDLDDANKDGYRYRGRGYIQLTGRGNYKKATEEYNKKYAVPLSKSKVTWETNENELLMGDKGMAATMVFWKYIANLVSRSDMGTSEDALKVITYKVNTKLLNLDERRRFLEKAVEILGAKDCVDYKRRNANEGTVIVVSGEATEKISGFAAYPVSVYRGMTLETYKKMKSNNTLPQPDYTTKLGRDAHDIKDENGIVLHANTRYGKNNECPPGEYYLNSKKNVVGGGSFLMYVSDSSTTKSINGPDGTRGGIAIHKWACNDSQGCLTTLTGSDNSKVEELLDAIPDLFVHNQMEDAGFITKRRPVRITLEERDVEEETWEKSANGTKRWRGKISSTTK